MPSKAIQKYASPPQDLTEVPKAEVLTRDQVADRVRERWLPHLDELMTVQMNIALNDAKGKPGIDARKAIFDRLFGPVAEREQEQLRQPIVIQFNRVEGGNPEILALESSLSAPAVEGEWSELEDLPTTPPPPPTSSVELLLSQLPEDLPVDDDDHLPPFDPALVQPPPLPPEPPPPKLGAGPGGKYARSPGHSWKDKRPTTRPSAPGERSR